MQTPVSKKNFMTDLDIWIILEMKKSFIADFADLIRFGFCFSQIERFHFGLCMSTCINNTM